jgi:hypothetical protein
MKRFICCFALLFALTVRSDASTPYQWGMLGDVPVPGDYDGDGKADLAVYRPSTSQWFVLLSSTHYSTFVTLTWGEPEDVPVAADYDGFGQMEVAVFRPSAGMWFVYGAIMPPRLTPPARPPVF